VERVTNTNGVTRAAIAVTAARVVVQASLVAAVATGCWLVFRTQPWLALTLAAIFGAAALLARGRFDLVNAVVLLFSCTSTGLLLLFTSAYTGTTIWLAALAGLVAGGCSWKTWSGPTEWRWPLMLWLLGVALSWPILAGREADFAVLTPGDGVGAIVVGALGTLSTGLWFDAALGWDVRRMTRWAAWPLLASVLAAAAAVYYQAFVDITWLSSAIWIQSGRAPGLMGDANPMAVAAAIWAPLAPFVWRGRAGLAGGVLVTLLLWYAAWLTGARSVILLVAAGAIGLTGGLLAQRTSPRRARWFVAAAGCAVLIAVSVLARQPASGPIGRLAATLPLDRPLDLAYEVLWRRDGYGLAAVRAIQEHPWSGVGHGAFNFVSSYYYRLEGGPLVPPDNAQNLWRHSLAERGLFGFVAVLALTIVTVRLLLRPAVSISTAYAWTLKAIVVGLGLALMVGLPVQNPAIALMAALLLAWLHAAVARRTHDARTLAPAVVGLVWTLAIAGAVIDTWNARGDLRPPVRAARVGDPYVYGAGAIETGPRGATGRIVREHAVGALRVTNARYRMRCWVRGSEARHVKIWQDQRLIVDELLPGGVVIERTLDAPSTPGMLLEFETEEPGMVIGGEFVP
jgi:O-antigen ligase